MNFKNALALMKKGKKMKLSAWGGYWAWDDEKQTVMIHCKDGKVLDIRDTDDVSFTLNNVACEDWEVATIDNCELVQKETDSQKALFNSAESLVKAWENSPTKFENISIRANGVVHEIQIKKYKVEE